MTELSRREFLTATTAGFAVTAEAQNIRDLQPVTPEQQKAALEYLKLSVNPILSKHALDPKEIPGISKRLLKMSRLTGEGKLRYEAVAAPFAFDPEVIAKIDYEKKDKVNRLLAFVPKIKADQVKYNWGSKPSDFEDYLVLTFAHEMIHLELQEKDPVSFEQSKQGWPNRQLMLENEAEAWRVSLVEIVRPMLKAKRHVPQVVVDANALLIQCNDNPKDPRWIKRFATYFK